MKTPGFKNLLVGTDLVPVFKPVAGMFTAAMRPSAVLHDILAAF